MIFVWWVWNLKRVKTIHYIRPAAIHIHTSKNFRNICQAKIYNQFIYCTSISNLKVDKNCILQFFRAIREKKSNFFVGKILRFLLSNDSDKESNSHCAICEYYELVFYLFSVTELIKISNQLSATYFKVSLSHFRK